MYSGGRGVRQDLESAFYHCEQAAKQGLPEAQHALAHYYERGTNHASELMRFYWFRQAALQCYPPAMYNLGVCYLHGIGTDKSPKDALPLFFYASQAGYKPAVKMWDEFLDIIIDVIVACLLKQLKLVL
jgi:TPR repeat protein